MAVELNDVKDFVKDVAVSTVYLAFLLGGAAAVKTVLVAFIALL